MSIYNYEKMIAGSNAYRLHKSVGALKSYWRKDKLPARNYRDWERLSERWNTHGIWEYEPNSLEEIEDCARYCEIVNFKKDQIEPFMEWCRKNHMKYGPSEGI